MFSSGRLAIGLLLDGFAACDGSLIVLSAVFVVVIVVACKSIIAGDSVTSVVADCIAAPRLNVAVTAAFILSTMVRDTVAGDVVPLRSVLPVTSFVRVKFRITVSIIKLCCDGIAVGVVVFGR